MALHKPTTLHDTYGLAKLVEDKLHHARSRFLPNRPATTPSPSLPRTLASSPIPQATNPPLLPAPPKPTAPLPFTRLSPEALQKRRADGLCFRCPEKYHPGHKCSPPQFLLIADYDDFVVEPVTNTTPSHTSDIPNDLTNDSDFPQFLSLSTAAFLGVVSPKALRITGHIYNKPITILIDSGSTHNIVQPRIIHHLHLASIPVPSFPVMVGNGEKLSCTGFCPNTPLQLDHTMFTIPLFILPIEGADLVLGMAWLSTLGPVLADFSIPQMAFSYNNQDILLRGEPRSKPTSPAAIHAMLRQDTIDALYTMLPQPASSTKSEILSHPDQKIEQLLTTFTTVFMPPQSLPPPRSHDHHIPTIPTAAPVNVRPYRYPHYQKEIMTTLISDMLREGIITTSQSPYSSPVLLVRKKDGTWRFCVDYRALNAITIRDRFPIPTVDELLD